MVVMDAAQCQSWKAQPPMLVTEMGISTLRREVQPPEKVSDFTCGLQEKWEPEID